MSATHDFTASFYRWLIDDATMWRFDSVGWLSLDVRADPSFPPTFRSARIYLRQRGAALWALRALERAYAEWQRVSAKGVAQ